MNLSPDDKELAPIENLLGDEYSSPLPSEDELQEAWADPSSVLVRENLLPELVTKNGVKMLRAVQGRAGIVTGIPSGVLGSFAQTIASAAANQAVGDWRTFATGPAVQATIDVALKAMGAIPIVGWIASSALSLVTTFAGGASGGNKQPPIATYKKTQDEREASLALAVTDSLDWTPLFMPVIGDVPWKLTPTGSLSGGSGSTSWYNNYLVQPYNTDTREEIPLLPNSWGCLPGGATGSTIVKSKGDQSDYESLNLFGHRPSVARCAMAAWVAATSDDTPALFNIETTAPSIAWREYVHGALAAAESGIASKLEPRRESVRVRRAAWLSLWDQMYMRNHGFDEYGGDVTLATVSTDQMRNLFLRQLEALDTLQVAYCSKKQAAFQGNSEGARILGDKLKERRAQLLTHNARWHVSPNDVPDEGYRFELRSAGAGVRPIMLAPPSGDFGGIRVTPPGDLPPWSGEAVPSEDGAGAAVVAAAAGAAVWLLL